jgi:DNA-binding MarR family transcriptional regulator
MATKLKERSRRAKPRKRPGTGNRGHSARITARPDASAELTAEVRVILDKFRLTDVMSHLLRRAHFAAEERFAQAFADEQITPRQKATLIAVYQQPGLSQNMLAEHLFMDRNTVAELVSRLVARRLLERRPSAEDQRAYELFLANKGAAMLNRVMPLDAAVEHSILQGLPRQSAKLLMKYLRQIARAT